LAYKIYIANFEVKEEDVDGFDSIKVKKVLSETYWGYWNEDGFGFGTDGSTKVTIKDQLVSSYIKKIFERDSFSAQIPVVILNEDSGQRVELLIDFSDYGEVDCCYVQCSFRAKGGGDLLRSREKVEYPLQLIEDIQVPLRDLPNNINFTVDNATHNVLSTEHSVPLLVSETFSEIGTAQSVGINQVRAFEISNISGCIQLIGSIKVFVQSNVSKTLNYYLRVNGVDTLVGSCVTDTSLTERTITINETLTIGISDELFLYAKSDTEPTTFTYTYNDSSSGLSILRCSEEPIEWKTVKAISVRNAFATIIQQSTNSTSELISYLFDSCEFDGYLTNNEGLVGQNSSINVSLFKLFEELNNKYPSSINIEGTKVSVLARCEFMVCGTPYRLEPILVNRVVNSDLLYSNIKVGYNNWKSESKFGSLEYNSTREYQTEYVISANSLSLLNDWSSSSSIISEQIRKKKEKDEIHWIIVNKETGNAETDEYITAGIYQSDRAINLRITPVRNLNRWRKFMLNNSLFTSGTGNYNFSSDDEYTCGCIEEGGEVSEDQDITHQPIIGNFVYNLELDSCGTDIGRLKGCVSFDYCGVEKIGFVKSLEYAISQTQSEVIYLQVIELL
jgi:hypothetical protein